MGFPAVDRFSGTRYRCDIGHHADHFFSRGRKLIAPLFGFVEVFIWITVVAQIVGGAKNNLLAYFAYASGFAVGNYFGMVLEDKLAIGTLVIRIILPKKGMNWYNIYARQVMG